MENDIEAAASQALTQPTTVCPEPTRSHLRQELSPEEQRMWDRAIHHPPGMKYGLDDHT